MLAVRMQLDPRIQRRHHAAMQIVDGLDLDDRVRLLGYVVGFIESPELDRLFDEEEEEREDASERRLAHA